MGRRELIADAGIRLIACGGTHRLTHRHVDAEAGLAAGSTSYYARTRRDLIALVANRLSELSRVDAVRVRVPRRLDLDEAADLIEELMIRMAGRRDAQAARFALLFEVRNDEELRALLTANAPVRADFGQIASEFLSAVGAPDPGRAEELVALLDALLMYRAVEAAPLDVRAVVTAYLVGMTAQGVKAQDDGRDPGCSAHSGAGGA